MSKRLISVLGGLVALSFLYGCGGGKGDAEADSSFTLKQVPVYEKDKSDASRLTCIFNDSMPNVPLVSLEEYLDLIYGEDSDYTLRGWGNHYTVTGKNKNTKKTGSKLIVNTKKETLTFKNFEDFVVGKKDGTMVDYVDMNLVSREGAPAITYDLSEYGIDIRSQDGQVFLPLSTLSDILDQSLTYPDYIDGTVYLIRIDSTGSDPTSHVWEKEDEYYETLTREEDVAAFGYRELCFVLDNLYGRPERAQSREFTDSLLTLGLDKTLEKGGTMEGIELEKLRSYLSSTNKAQYAQGLVMLDNLLYDGGHSMLSSPFLFRLVNDEGLDDNDVSRGYKKLFDEDPFAKDTANHLLDLIDETFVTGNILRGQRWEGFGEPSRIWEDNSGLEIAYIYLFDNTAIFCFDEFCDEVIRSSTGSKPFLEALEYAKENGCENFVIDLSTNGGGSDQTMGYILSMIFEKDAAIYHVDKKTGARNKLVFTADKNLDGTIDEKDAEVKFGFCYAVMTSRYTYSCGNYASVLAKENGIPLIGETSGGGECLVTNFALPNECNAYQLSSIIGMTDANFQGVDGGASPTYPLTVDPVRESYTTQLYDPQEIVSIVNKHYH